MRFGRVVVSFLLAVSAFGQTARKVDFGADVQPILKKRCEACHGAAQQISGLRLDQREGAMAGGYSGPVIVPGKSAESKLIQRVTGAPGVMVMPPSGPRLTPEEIGVLRAWIDSGATWTPPRHQWHRRRRNRVIPIGHFNRSRFLRSLAVADAEMECTTLSTRSS